MTFTNKFPQKLLFKVSICALCFIDVGGIHANTISTYSNTENLFKKDWIYNTSKKCGGYFKNPIKEYKNLDFEKNILEASADKSSLEQEKLIFNGNVVINHGNINATSDIASYDSSKEILNLKKNIIIRTPMVGVGADLAKIDLTNQEAEIEKTSYIIHSKNAHGEAKKIKINQKNNTFIISDGNYSYCPPENKFWELSAREIKIDNNISQGIAKMATLKIKGKPILFIPYAQFPIGNERQSGFLSPSLSKNSEGIDLSLPYYFNIAPNFDVVISPRYNSNHGQMTEVSTRALTKFEYWRINLAYLNNEKSSQNFLNEERWLLSVKESGEWSKNLYSKIDFTKVSDTNYFQDLNSHNFTINRKSHVNQNASLNYYGNNITAGLSIQQYQYLLNRNANLKVEKNPSWFLKYESNNSYFKPDYKFEFAQSNFSHDAGLRTLRNLGEASVSFPMHWRGIEFKPNIGLEYLSHEVDASYFNNGQNIKRSVSSTRNQLEINLSLIKEAINSQLIDIKFFYINRKSNREYFINNYFDSEWLNFNDNYFSGEMPFSNYDINLNSNYISTFISHSLLNSYGEKKITTKFGQIHYLGERGSNSERPLWLNYDNSKSPIYAEFELARTGNWKTFISLNINERNKKPQEGHFILNYKNREEKPTIFNIGYHYRNIDLNENSYNPKIEQSNLSFIKSLNEKWSILGRYSYDYNLKRENEFLSGISYDGCCFRLSVIYRDAILKSFNNNFPNRDRSIYLKFDLKGLFGIGEKIDNIINRSIEGFDENNSKYF